MANNRNARPIAFLLVTVFLTAIGMMVVAPVLPFFVKQYVSNPSHLAVVIGWLTATYSICQFLAAPGLGALSDRYGRRPLLLLCMLGSALGYVIFGVGGALWVLFLGRVIDGLTGGDLSILMAYVADISAPEDRGRLFGQIGATVGAGFILGPVIGGFMAKLSVAAPLYLTAAIMLVNMLWGYFALPESLRAEDRRARIRLAELNPFTQLRAVLAMPQLRGLLLIGFLYGLDFVFMQTTQTVLVMEHLGWQPDRISLLYLLVGVTDILVQGLLVGRLQPVFGEKRLAIAGMAGVMIGFALIGAIAYVAAPFVLVAGVAVLALSSGLLEPSLSSLVSQAAGASDQGAVQGGVQSIRSLAAIGGPLLAGVLYAQFGHASPYGLGVVLMGLAIVVTCVVVPSRRVNPGVAEETVGEA